MITTVEIIVLHNVVEHEAVAVVDPKKFPVEIKIDADHDQG